MTSRATSIRRKWVLGLALIAAFALGSARASAATYEEGGGGAAAAQQSHWTWAGKRKVAQRHAFLSAIGELWILPASGKKPSLQKKATAPR